MDEQSSGDPFGAWAGSGLPAEAFLEQDACLRAVYQTADDVVRTAPETPPEYQVRMDPVPAAFFTPRKNLFSALFYAAYLALGIPRPRRMLYGQLNQLFRIWVTSADNLLDGEDKCVLPLAMPGASRVMQNVVAIMAADRVLWRLAGEAVTAGTLTPEQADRLVMESLRQLLPSAAQEASEEGGIQNRPEPAYILETVHRFKTGLLFNVPFLGVELVETTVDHGRLARLKDALRRFGIGCQILDDVRDVGRDFVERRHNYVLSVLAHEQPAVLAGWTGRHLQPEARLYLEVLPVSLAAARLGLQQLREACAGLQAEGVIAPGAATAQMAFAMLGMLDLEELSHGHGLA